MVDSGTVFAGVPGGGHALYDGIYLVLFIEESALYVLVPIPARPGPGLQVVSFRYGVCTIEL